MLLPVEAAVLRDARGGAGGQQGGVQVRNTEHALSPCQHGTRTEGGRKKS